MGRWENLVKTLHFSLTSWYDRVKNNVRLLQASSKILEKTTWCNFKFNNSMQHEKCNNRLILKLVSASERNVKDGFYKGHGSEEHFRILFNFIFNLHFLPRHLLFKIPLAQRPCTGEIHFRAYCISLTFFCNGSSFPRAREFKANSFQIASKLILQKLQ